MLASVVPVIIGMYATQIADATATGIARRHCSNSSFQ